MSAVPKLRFREYKHLWINAELESVVEKVTSGSRDWAQYYSDKGDKFVRMTNLPKRGVRLLLDNLKFVNVPKTGSEGQRTSLNAGDVLISITAELGKIGLVPEGLGIAYINQHTALVRPNQRELNSEYFSQYLATRKSNKRLNRLNDSGAKSGLNLSTIKKFQLTFPSLPEQKKIADFLGAVDDKIAGLRERERLLTEYKKGVMQKIFTQTLRFKANDGSDFPDWEECRLGDLVSISNARSKMEFKVDEGKYFIVDMGSINRDGKLVVSKQTNHSSDMLVKGQLIMPKDDIGGGLIIGRVAMIDENDKYILSDHVYALTCKGVVPSFLDYRINSFEVNKSFRQKANGTAQLGIGKSTVLEQIVLCPVSIDEQQKIADFLSAIDDKITAVSAQTTQMQDFKKGLLQQMFV